MSDLSFAEPQWVHLLWLVAALVAALLWFDQRGRRSLDRFLSTPMQQRLVSRPKASRRLLRIVFLGLSSLCLVLALMRPQSGVHYVQTPRIGSQVMVCLDVSRSMLATDVVPNRLNRAKAEIQDLLAYLENDHVGLIAFAGKATVLCPLTPDFGFLRLRLASAGPASVARGGTDLAAPIRKAVAGFRGHSDLSRAIILITDGEEHDSFALDAATAAAERGIRIIAIGFGDEAGSEVFVDDPQTGARTQLLDGNDEPVITRLDGELLGKIALETGGPYIPAGTGALDLKSIYDAHIAPLTRGRLDDRGRLVKRDRYQWAVLAALVCLVAAATVASGKPAPKREAVVSQAAPVMTALALFLATTTAGAQTTGNAEAPLAPAADPRSAEPATATPPRPGRDDQAIDPRQAYNEALAMLQADKLDDAERRFLLVRRRAGSDGQARYRSTYNLGWVQIKRADPLIKDQPEQALEHLHGAADWFREAVESQPEDTAARQNLEIVARRAVALADALARRDEGDLAALVDALIAQQRQFMGLLAGTMQRVGQLDEPTLPDHLRREFRSLEVEQRRILTGLDETAQHAREQADRLDGISQDQRTAEQGLRQAQLGGVQAYLFQAAQRLGQTRHHLRARQAERAYRRASAGLGDLKRARDQLRNLVEALGDLIPDAVRLTRQTAQLAAAESRPAVGTDPLEPSKPPWLTRQYLADLLEMVRDRTDELVGRVEAGLAKEEPTPGSGATGPPVADDAQMADFLSILAKAAPLMRQARDAFNEAGEALASLRDDEALTAQSRATAQLLEARELFLDIRGLIELMVADQKRIQAVLLRLDQPDAAAISEYLPMVAALQAENVSRARRLDGLLERKHSVQDPDRGSADRAPLADGGADQSTKDRQIELARKLLAAARVTLADAQRSIADLNGTETDTAVLAPLHTLVDRAVDQIEALRRLFFSAEEHLQETHRRQVDLADQTGDVTALTEPDRIPDAVGPLSQRQQELSQVSQQIAEALGNQSQQPAAAAAPQAQNPEADSQDAAHRLLQASGAVREAADAMDQAVEQLRGEPIDLPAAQQHQATAVGKLAEALELVAPPPQQPPQEQDQAQEGGGDDQDQADEPSSRQMDLSHLLQAVRDREAERQRERSGGKPSGYEPVEKDW